MFDIIFIITVLPVYWIISFFLFVGSIFSESNRLEIAFALPENVWIYMLIGLLLWILIFYGIYRVFIRKIAHSIETRFFKKL